jgi:choline-sulfatase
MSQKPNLLFLFSDQHAQKITGCYGDEIVKTPNLDRIAKNGVVFNNAYCPSPLCVPSRMSLLSGRYPSQQEVWMNDDFLASDVPTFAHSLGAAGYRPTIIGRMHAIGPDQLHGYVHREVGDHSPNWIGIGRHNMGVLKGAPGPGRATIDKSGIGQSAYQIKDVDTTKAALDFFDIQNSTEPFCLTVGLMLPHAPYVASAEDYALYDGKVGRAPLSLPDKEHPWLNWWREKHNIVDVPEEHAIRARTAYYALVTRMDIMIGQILDKLKERGLLDNTLIVYSSDHGDQIGERGLWWKHTFYEESVKIPMILSWPGQLPKNEARDQVVNLVDLNATFLDALGADPLPNSEGNSLLNVAKDNSSPWQNLTFSEYCSDATKWDGMRQRMIRQDDWKLIYYHGFPTQLFNLTEDPQELIDLADAPEDRAIKENLLSLLLKDWDPDTIEQRMLDKQSDKEILGTWARKTSPTEAYIWDLTPEMNILNDG